MAKASKRYKSHRICIDSLPTNCAYLIPNLTPTMSTSNMSCSSCICCVEEDQTQCCNSEKCAINVTRQQQTQTCCKSQEPDEFDLNCPLCREAMKKSLAKASGLCTICQEKDDEDAISCSVCKEHSQKKDDGKCPNCNKKKDDNTCPKCNKKEDDNKCPKCTKEDDNKCPKCNKKEDVNKCPKCKKEEDNKCPKCNKKEDDNKCPKCKKEEDNTCPKCSKKEEENKCPNCNKKEDDNMCPKCKNQDASSTKILEKQLRCPSCSQPVAIQCCAPGNNNISLVLIPEKLLKDSATNKSDNDLPCCPVQKKPVVKKKSSDKMPCPVCSSQEVKAPCCKIEEPCINTANSRASLNKQGKDNKAGCGNESCMSVKKTDKPAIKKPSVTSAKKLSVDASKSAVDQKGKEGKEGKSKKEKSVTEATDAAADEDDNQCSCVCPPAYKQYKCMGKINGVCDCSKQDEPEAS